MRQKHSPSSKIAASPIIRWAGSKRKLVADLLAAVPFEFGVYFEPFFGSGCFFFELRPKMAVLNDLNTDLVDFYRVALEHPEHLLRSARQFKRTPAKYYEIRERLKYETDKLQKASFFLYLNRLCFNGIYRTNSKGHFNVPFGSRTGAFPTIAEFRAAASLLKNARLLSEDFESSVISAQRGDFVYLDPPYVYNDRKDRGEYGPRSFSVDDIPRLQAVIDALDKRKVKFLLSYLDCNEIKVISGKYNVKKLPVARCISGLASSRQIVNELLISNY